MAHTTLMEISCRSSFLSEWETMWIFISWLQECFQKRIKQGKIEQGLKSNVVRVDEIMDYLYLQQLRMEKPAKKKKVVNISKHSENTTITESYVADQPMAL